MKKIASFISLLLVFISGLIILCVSIISIFIDDLFSNKIYHHTLLGIMIAVLSLYSIYKSLKSLNKDLDSNN